MESLWHKSNFNDNAILNLDFISKQFFKNKVCEIVSLLDNHLDCSGPSLQPILSNKSRVNSFDIRAQDSDTHTRSFTTTISSATIICNSTTITTSASSAVLTAVQQLQLRLGHLHLEHSVVAAVASAAQVGFSHQLFGNCLFCRFFRRQDTICSYSAIFVRFCFQIVYIRSPNCASSFHWSVRLCPFFVSTWMLKTFPK